VEHSRASPNGEENGEEPSRERIPRWASVQLSGISKRRKNAKDAMGEEGARDERMRGRMKEGGTTEEKRRSE